jgi:hypothetical protein
MVGLGPAGGIRPANLDDRNRVSRFFISNFSYTSNVRAPQSTELKFPFRVSRYELRQPYFSAPEAGGFGPLYGALLLCAAVAVILLIVEPGARATRTGALLIAAGVVLSVLVHSETWWARYVPQAWLIPVAIAVASVSSPRRSHGWWAGRLLIGFATLNLVIVGANASYDQFVYARETKVILQEISAAPRPVAVFFGPFMSLRQRLREAHIEFTMLESQPPPSDRRRPLLAWPNRAFWLK